MAPISFFSGSRWIRFRVTFTSSFTTGAGIHKIERRHSRSHALPTVERHFRILLGQKLHLKASARFWEIIPGLSRTTGMSTALGRKRFRRPLLQRAERSRHGAETQPWCAWGRQIFPGCATESAENSYLLSNSCTLPQLIVQSYS